MSHAIKYTSWEGVPVIDCKKCYYDNKIEKEQLEEFAKKGIAFLKNIENVTLIGTHTTGCVSSGNCVKIYLPNSCEAFFDMLKNI